MTAEREIALIKPVGALTFDEYVRLTSYIEIVWYDGTEWTCWEWQGKQDHRGYGRFWYRDQWQQAHRYFYTWVDEATWKMWESPNEIPEDRQYLDHLCENRRCVRPSHLKPCTHKENHEARSQRYWARKSQLLGG